MKPTNLDPNDPLVRTAIFGEQVQDFLRSDIGAFLVTHINAKVHEIECELHERDFDSTEAFKLKQIERRMYESLQAWLGDAIHQGITATAVIDGEEDIDG